MTDDSAATSNGAKGGGRSPPAAATISPLAAFTTRRELTTYLKRRLDTFINPLVYTFWDNRGTPSIMTISAALAE